jgi:hypothetical protein
MLKKLILLFFALSQPLFANSLDLAQQGITQIGSGLSALLLGKKTIDDDLLDELEMLLIGADMGINSPQLLKSQKFLAGPTSIDCLQ